MTDRYIHRHIQRLYGAWPLHEISPEDESSLVRPALKALDKRGDLGDSRLLSAADGAAAAAAFPASCRASSCSRPVPSFPSAPRLPRGRTGCR
ncbi:hypothetical protein ACFU3E_38295 [Streptomyces sp. NPDC057424]|uniref:hypothetical protein n=1 Tax=Streptomyces sp. NPDC057424 TaxID=3346127 RepID=UPI0036937CB3